MDISDVQAAILANAALAGSRVDSSASNLKRAVDRLVAAREKGDPRLSDAGLFANLAADLVVALSEVEGIGRAAGDAGVTPDAFRAAVTVDARAGAEIRAGGGVSDLSPAVCG